MGTYRSRLEIIADMLSVVQGGARKTQIMFKANLSYELLSRYLAEVLDADLVSFEGSAGCYRLTRKGQEFLSKFNEYSRRRKQLEEQINDLNNKRIVLKKMVTSNSDIPDK